MDASRSVMATENLRMDGGPLIDLHKVYAVIRRRQWWIVFSVAIVMVLAAIAYVVAPRYYQATATVALDRSPDQAIAIQNGGNQAAQGALLTDSPTVDTAVQVLTSTMLAGEVVDQLGLANIVGFGQPKDGPPRSQSVARASAIGSVLAGLTVKRVGVSYAITVQFVGADPLLTTKIANGMVDAYIADQRKALVGGRSQEVSLIATRLPSLRESVIRAESAEAQYRAQHNLIDVQNNSTAVQQEMSVLNTQFAAAQADEAAARSRLSAVEASNADESSNANSTTGAGTSGAMTNLLVQKSQLNATRADLAHRYGPLHPDLARVDQELRAINASIASENTRVRAELLANVREASGRAAAILGSLDRARGGLAAGNAASVQLNELTRNADSARGLYQAFLDRYRQSVAGQGTEQSNAYVIAHAMMPFGPSSPVLLLFAAGGLVAACVGSGLLVLMLELLESGFKTRQDVESKLGLPLIASVPNLRKLPGGRSIERNNMGAANYLITHGRSVFHESFRAIRTELHLGHADQKVRTLAICSPLPDEGKTTIAICLARSAALAGLRVLLVDCDIRRRASTHTVTGVVSNGLIEVLKGNTTLDRAVVRDDATGMKILAQSEEGAADYDLLSSEAMQQLVPQLGKAFDLVVLDTAPILPLAETRAIANMADGVLLVTRWRKTPVRAAELACDMLTRAGAHVCGVVLSLVDINAQAQGGVGDEMLYYNKFKKYYA